MSVDEKKPSLLEQAKAQFKATEDWWRENRKEFLADAKFRLIGKGNQWPDDIKKYREDNKLPCLEVDKLNQYVRQVVNDGRQNRPAVKVSPIDDRGDKQIAETLQGLIRHICDRSNADEAFDTALDHAAGCGFGFFRVLTEYAHENTFNQELVVRRVPNPLACMLGKHELADGSDAKVGFFFEDIPKDEYKKRYPSAKVVDWAHEGFRDDWAQENTVRICEYWYKVEEQKELLLLEDGTTATREEYAAATNPAPVKDQRLIPQCVVKFCRLSGAEILEEREWRGKYIPIIPVYGNEQNIEGKVTYSGLIRAAKDPQRLYNFSRSAFAQRVALTTKSPWMAAAEQIADYPEWKTANTGTHQVLRYKHTAEDGSVIPPPQRISASDVPAGFAQDMELAEHDIQASMGMYAASLGQQSNEKSGKAIMARQREGDTATFHYQDNLNRAIRYLGRILVDAAPKYYDSTRVVRILGEDGTADMVRIDPRQAEAVTKDGTDTIYNIGVGKYDVSVAAGPSYTTKRQEAAEGMMQLVQSAPETMQFAGDLIVKNMDWPGADELAERYKMMLPPSVQEALQNQEQEDPKVAAVVAQAKQMMDAAQQAIQERDQALQQATQELQALKADKHAAKIKADTDYYNAQTERMRMEYEQANPPPQPVDTSEIEFAKLELERDKMKLDNETKVIVAEIGANSKAETANIGAASAANSAQMGATAGVEGAGDTEPAEPPIDTNAVLATVLSEFQQAIQGFHGFIAETRKPRKILRDANGNISGVQ